MVSGDKDMSWDFLSRLKADLEKTMAAYQAVDSLRAKKISQDLEQIKVYLNILENQRDSIKLNGKNSRKINRLLAWKAKTKKKNIAYRKQQDQLEDHFLELQKALVGLISKRFKY
jgi:hypothetical protein